ncbi:MAG: HEAT repeat domain-containing protein [Elusimicrobia bacterium]|nr:HEAT repeat domain-containing protein [Elusimicrobiota bacterium]
MTSRRLLPVLCLLSGCGVATDSLALRREADARAPRSVALKAALNSRDQNLRAQAVAAMGRTGSKEYAPALRSALRDEDARVRYEAAFALGQLWIEDPAPAAVEIASDLIPAIADAAPTVRAAAVEALGKLGAPDLEPKLAGLLSDPEALVRREASTALFRLRYLKRLTAYSSTTVQALVEAFDDPDAETRWRAVYAFSRWPEPGVATELARAAEDESPNVRLFALRSLAQLEAKAPEEPLEAALRDPDERVRAEAVALAKKAGRTKRLGDAVLKDPDAHVRAAAADALGDAEGNLALLEELAKDRSGFVRAAAIASLAKRSGDALESRMRDWIRDADPWLRVRACAAAGELPKSGAKLLDLCLKDPDARVRASALETLAKVPGGEVDVALSVALTDEAAPIEIVGTAMDSVTKRKTPELTAAVAKAYKRSKGREWVEVRESAVDAAEHLAGLPGAGDKAGELLREMLKDPAPSVRLKAAKALKAEPPRAASQGSPGRFLEAEPPASALVTLETEKGLILIQLATDLAPVHSASFLDLVRRGFYDGKTIHRVVSNFVVQGGDPRGSGWGDPGYALRDEIGPLKFARGTVGMAKAGRDTGGCQFFVTLVPTPHLDGRYTAFGRVVGGMDVVDRLIPGDVILRANVR